MKSTSPWQTLEDMIAAGKKEPDKYNYGTSGVGGTGQLMMIEVEQATGTKYTTVPYKGGAEWMQALLGDQVHFLADAAQWAPFVDDGKCRILAKATEKRIPRYKDTPTLIERGINVVGQSPYGLVGPKGMDPAVMKKLHDAFKKAMDDPRHAELMLQLNQDAWYRSGADFAQWAREAFAKDRLLIERLGLAAK